MPLSLRQVAIVAGERDRVVSDLVDVLGLAVCFVDEAVDEFGLENALLPLGTQFFEVVAPIRPGTAAARYLERRGGDGGYMVITQAADAGAQAAARERAAALGIRVAWEQQHTHGRYMQLHPRDTGGCFFEIDSVSGNDPAGRWPPAGDEDWHAYLDQARVTAITAVDIQCPDPASLAARWCAIAGSETSVDDAGRHVLQLRNAAIRFVAISDERGEGLCGVDLRSPLADDILRAAAARSLDIDGNAIMLGGLRIELN